MEALSIVGQAQGRHTYAVPKTSVVNENTSTTLLLPAAYKILQILDFVTDWPKHPLGTEKSAVNSQQSEETTAVVL